MKKQEAKLKALTVKLAALEKEAEKIKKKIDAERKVRDKQCAKLWAAAERADKKARKLEDKPLPSDHVEAKNYDARIKVTRQILELEGQMAVGATQS